LAADRSNVFSAEEEPMLRQSANARDVKRGTSKRGKPFAMAALATRIRDSI
jgi:hypothetical protein